MNQQQKMKCLDLMGGIAEGCSRMVRVHVVNFFYDY